jgi:hypothetical protein
MMKTGLFRPTGLRNSASQDLLFVPMQRVTAIKLSVVGAGHARDERTATLQSSPKCRGRGPLLRCHCNGSGALRGNEEKLALPLFAYKDA